jgi:limbic system-associated membrane protein
MLTRAPIWTTERWLCFSTLVLCLFAVGHCQDPEIVNDILPDVKRVGMTGKLNCTVARLGENTVLWSFTGQPKETISINLNIQVLNNWKGGIPAYKVIRTDEAGDRTTFTLIISRLLPIHSGTYECLVQVANKESSLWTRRTGVLIVQQPPMIRPGSTDSVKLVDQGENTTITCDAVGVPSPNITWVRSDGKLLPNGKAIFRGRTMTISQADVNYSGVYRCVADNNIKPPAESLTQVQVLQAPSVRVLQDSVGQYSNGKMTAKLDCIVQGYPIPTVHWMITRRGQEQKLLNTEKYETTKQATDKQNLFAGEQWYTLKISFVMADDFRDYFCVGTNSKGNGTAKVTLFATWDCQGPSCISLDPENRSCTSSVHLWSWVVVVTVAVATVADKLWLSR